MVFSIRSVGSLKISPARRLGASCRFRRRVKQQYTGRDPFPSEHLRPIGLIGDIASWMDDCAISAAPLLSLGAAISLVGALCGRRYAAPSGLRANSYLVGVARSGVGKENGRQCALSLLTRSGLDAIRGTDEIASAAGLLKKMSSHPTRLFCLDEIGRLLAAIGSRNAGTHEKAIATTLMKLHSAAPGVFLGTAYAERAEEPIEQPHCVVWGTTTPDSFYGALRHSDVIDGFLNRLIVLEADHGQAPARAPRANLAEPPTELVERVKALGEGAFIPTDGGNLSAVASGISRIRFAPFVVLYGPGAEELLAAFSEGVRTQVNEASTPEIWARTREHAIRLALAQGVAENPSAPRITVEAMRWGSRIAWWAARRIEVAIAEKMHQGDEQRCAAEILKLLGRHGGEAQLWRVTRATRAYDRRVRDAATRDLVDSGQLVIDTSHTSGRSAILYRLSHQAIEVA